MKKYNMTVKRETRYWKKISGKIVYKNPWIKIHEDKVLRPDGKEGLYGYLEKPVGVFIVVYDSKKETVLFIRHHRYPIRKRILEIPAGVSRSKNYLAEAKRELFEETGLKAKRWEHLGSFYIAPGHESTSIKTFLALGPNKKNTKIDNQEGDEAISDIVEVKLSELPQKILDGKIECGLTLASLNLFLQWRLSKI